MSKFIQKLGFGLLFVAIVALLSVGGWLALKRNIDAAKGVGYKDPKEIGQNVVQKSIVESLGEDQAKSFVESALAVRVTADVDKYFRIGENSPDKIVAFLSALQSKEGEIAKIQWRGNNSAGRVARDELSVMFKVSGALKNRVALLIPDGIGKWKVDYDAFARTSTPSWSELIEGKSNIGEVRVFASTDNYYNGPFSDEREWQCYSFISPDTDMVMKGYSKMDSAQTKAMNSLLEDRKVARVTLEIRRVKCGESRQFEISRVLSSDWAKEEVIFDEKFQ
ncbi:MAG: hypothetical protein HC845_05660 [Akkermansiaceae bacterium]|nr:hypothetical protein [Akkermansiaceae bacterium]